MRLIEKIFGKKIQIEKEIRVENEDQLHLENVTKLRKIIISKIKDTESKIEETKTKIDNHNCMFEVYEYVLDLNIKLESLITQRNRLSNIMIDIEEKKITDEDSVKSKMEELDEKIH